MPDRNHPSRDAEEPRIASVLKQVHSRWLAGEDLPDEQICAAYPDLMPALGERLRDLRNIRRARQAIERMIPEAFSSPLEEQRLCPIQEPSFSGEKPKRS